MDDTIRRQDAIDLLRKRLIETANNNVGYTCDAGQTFEDASERIKYWIDEVPSAQSYTEAEIKTMQDLEQAQIEKAYQLGYEEGKKNAEQPERKPYHEVWISALRTAQPERTGKWIKNYSVIRCSECKRSSWSLSFEDLVRSFNNCPNCGCRMLKEGEEHETD